MLLDDYSVYFWTKLHVWIKKVWNFSILKLHSSLFYYFVTTIIVVKILIYVHKLDETGSMVTLVQAVFDGYMSSPLTTLVP